MAEAGLRMSIFQPSNQIKLTNVAVVRLKKGGKRFELACYRNKVLEHRRGVETDLDEVLQIRSIFANVSKGKVAPKADVAKAFGAMDEDAVIREILRKGEVQVGDKERAQRQEEVWRDVVRFVAEKCVDPTTRRAYSTGVIEKALAEAGFSVNTTKSPKQQALEAIRQLQDKGTIPIARAQMRLRVCLPAKEAKRIKERMMQCVAEVQEEEWSEEYELTCLIDPGQFRVLHDLLQAETKGRGRIETLSLSETVEQDERLV